MLLNNKHVSSLHAADTLHWLLCRRRLITRTIFPRLLWFYRFAQLQDSRWQRNQTSSSNLEFQKKNVFHSMEKVLSSQSINMCTKMRLLKCYVWSTLMWKTESWTISKRMESQLETAERSLRWMIKCLMIKFFKEPTRQGISWMWSLAGKSDLWVRLWSTWIVFLSLLVVFLSLMWFLRRVACSMDWQND